MSRGCRRGAGWQGGCPPGPVASLRAFGRQREGDQPATVRRALPALAERVSRFARRADESKAKHRAGRCGKRQSYTTELRRFPSAPLPRSLTNPGHAAAGR